MLIIYFTFMMHGYDTYPIC